MSPYVQRAAKLLGATVSLVHVVNPAAFGVLEAYELYERPMSEVSEDHKVLAGQKLDSFLKEEFPLVECFRILESGDAGTRIGEIARDEEFDLIIMPTHAGRFRQMLLGSTVAKVLDDAPCPVLTSKHAQTIARVLEENWTPALVDALQSLRDAGITLVLELLNSKVDHKDYQCDHTDWGVRVIQMVDSPRVKLLYDIYHMQIMEGDVIRTIRDNKQWLAHFHTGGVPGRHELDDTQELQWRTVAKAIVDSGFTGYYAHEFIPTRDPMTSLREAVVLCDV
jgi:hydroxypyruvate isomerase